MIARARSIAWPCAILLAALCVTPVAAQAKLFFAPDGVTLQTLDASGTGDFRAGIHPDRLITEFKVSETPEGPEDFKELTVDFPPGLGGFADAVPFCPRAAINRFLGECPPDTQVGMFSTNTQSFPVYNLEPGPNEVVALSVATPLPTTFVGTLRPEDQGLSLRIPRLDPSQFIEYTDDSMELWGVPADHQEGTSIPRRPLITTPTRCGAPLSITISIRTWQNPEEPVVGSDDTGQPLMGCDQLPFHPKLGFTLERPRADVSSGARVDLAVPQNSDPDGRASALIKDVDIVFPDGMTMSLAGAARMRACTDAQFGLGEASDPTCPDASRVGAVEMAVPGQVKPAVGRVYLGQEHPGDRFRLLIVASGNGATVKFVGSLHADPASGQLSADLNGLPQVPYSRLALSFDGGPGALLATPVRCGSAATTARFTPYSGTPPVASADAVGIATSGGGECKGLPEFAPTFAGGSTNDIAGHATGFTAVVSRKDGEQLPGQLEIQLPAGMSAALGTVDPCSAAAAAAAACPPASQIGEVVAELGPGSEPAQIEGGIHLTGPYKRNPFGIALVFKAASGPFDFGTIVVRGALRVNALSGQVTVVTDPLPRLVEGIPIRFGTIGLDLDRPGFMSNPTSCKPTEMLATLRSQEGAVAHASTPFGVRRCVDLPFHPAFSLALSGRSQLRAEGKPSLRIAARVPASGANLRSADISLPGLLKFDAGALREICARGMAIAGDCAKAARVGSASARTPLLHKPMAGSIYAVQPRGDGTPEMWIVLHGDGLEVSLKAKTAVRDGHPETKLVGLPDFPLSSFSMTLAAGRHGLLKLSQSPCRRALFAATETIGQNDARLGKRIRVATFDCGGDG